MIEAAGFRRVSFTPMTGGVRGASFGLAIVIAAISHLFRLARAGFVFAREGVFALVDTRPLPLPAKTAVAFARLFERPSGKRRCKPARPRR